MDKKDVRFLRAELWNLRGKHGADKVDFVTYITESFDESGDPQELDYGTIIEEVVYLRTPSGLIEKFSNVYPSVYGLNNNYSVGFTKFHKEVKKLATYFKGTAYILVEKSIDSEDETFGTIVVAK